ncbi:MAG: YitT family protein [candidate division KSB1 bacterium]|nr:YitT family protein [candidate division KSB1 bacterium]MDZ7334697.1 YitT family protein [candidate division KSB1 bacterium]MDZ7356201.1 YitT family protein [candidate division KSB1 bacterium]MDZ7375707.1 YitT family protein [candidate division KSB1 bacterium]MDZ7400344.1 YitT family protein [candidate division KSB1 bacterium]
MNIKFHPSLTGQIRDYGAITIGAFIMALGIGAFLTDAQVVPGGVSGLAMVIHYISGRKIPVGLTMWLLNIPLYLWGLRELGKQFGFRTFVGFSLSSFFIDLLRGNVPGFGFIQLQNSAAIQDLYRHDFILAVMFGATLLGVGLGVIFKFRGSTGGSDIVAAIMQKKHGWKPGQAFLVSDSLVITTAGLVIHWMKISTFKPALTLTLYAFVLLFISSKLIDIIIEGMDYAKAAIIISTKSEDIASAIMDDLSRGATALKGRGLYTNQDRDVIYTVVSRKEIGLLTEIVKAIDPNAFVIINNVHEVLGHGFRRRI